MNAALLIACKEAGDLLRDARGLAWLLVIAAALSIFSLLLVGNTELSLLDDAQVVYDMIGIVTALGALLAVVVATDSIAGERERGSLVPLLLTPVPRTALVLGKLGGQLIVWSSMFAIAVPYLWAVGSTGQNLFESVIVLAAFGTPAVLGFGFLTLGLAARMASARSCLLTALIALIVSASPLLLGPSLRQSAIGRGFDLINPFSGALNAYDAVIIDSQPIIAQVVPLAVVFTWLAITLAFALWSVRRIGR